MKEYLSLIKFSHTIFALPFALVGYTLGMVERNDSFDIKLFILVVLCMIFARSAAMAFNRWLDRDIDARNPRTIIREIPAGIIKSNAAWWFVFFNCVLFVVCTWFINTICFLLSPVALVVILGYSYTKRFTSLCHLVLGLGLSLAPVGAYLAVTSSFAAIPVLLGFAVLCWVSGFDVIYSLQDEEFDREHRLFSIPVKFGRNNAMRLSIVLHLFSALFMIGAIVLGYRDLQLGLLAITGLLIFLGMLTYQHIIIKPNDLSRVNLAFFTTNGFASLIFGGFMIADLLT